MKPRGAAKLLVLHGSMTTATHNTCCCKGVTYSTINAVSLKLLRLHPQRLSCHFLLILQSIALRYFYFTHKIFYSHNIKYPQN